MDSCPRALHVRNLLLYATNSSHTCISPFCWTINNSRSRWLRVLKRMSWPFRYWDHGVESRSGHGCLSLCFCVVLSCGGRGLGLITKKEEVNQTLERPRLCGPRREMPQVCVRVRVTCRKMRLATRKGTVLFPFLWSPWNVEDSGDATWPACVALASCKERGTLGSSSWWWNNAVLLGVTNFSVLLMETVVSSETSVAGIMRQATPEGWSLTCGAPPQDNPAVSWTWDPNPV
jgi:hypothetical protein